MVNDKGFTLIELLIVITLLAMLFSMVVPASYSMYERYDASMKAEKILTYLSSLRYEAFLYGEEKTVTSKDGKLYVNGEPVKIVDDISVFTDSEIKFYKTGTTNGGALRLDIKNYRFFIKISAPFGELTLENA